MNHRNGFNPLSRTTAHRRAMTRNMVTSLFRYERITTTEAKAKEVRKAAEKLITRAKVDSVHNRRTVAKFIADEKILNKLFTESAYEGDSDAIKTAANYEATLYKYRYENGERVESKTLYDPWGCYDEE